MKTRMQTGHVMRMSSVTWVALFTYAAGATGIFANLLLIAFYALQASYLEDGTSLGSANDLVGSLVTAFMIPLALSAWLPDGLLPRITQAVGIGSPHSGWSASSVRSAGVQRPGPDHYIRRLVENAHITIDTLHSSVIHPPLSG